MWESHFSTPTFIDGCPTPFVVSLDRGNDEDQSSLCQGVLNHRCLIKIQKLNTVVVVPTL